HLFAEREKIDNAQPALLRFVGDNFVKAGDAFGNVSAASVLYSRWRDAEIRNGDDQQSRFVRQYREHLLDDVIEILTEFLRIDALHPIVHANEQRREV